MIRTRVIDTLTRWPFLVALALLLLNDFCLKPTFPGFVTGKLSDVAGIALVALPLLAAFPNRARTIYLAVAGAFAWWKSPLSEQAIVLANDVLPYPIGRVVDYGDLFALFVLPLCRRASGERATAPGAWRRWASVPAVVIAMFATAATTLITPRFDVTIRTIDPQGTLPPHAAVAAIEEVTKELGLKCHDCSEPHVRGSYHGRKLWLGYRIVPPNAVRLSMMQGGGFISGSDGRKAERMREALKRSFRSRIRGLEAVEPLHAAINRSDDFLDPPPPRGEQSLDDESPVELPAPPASPPPVPQAEPEPDPQHPRPRPAPRVPQPAPVA